MRNHCRVEQVERTKQVSVGVGHWEYEVSEGAIQKVFETMRIEGEPPIDNKIQPIKTFTQSESATNFKGFEALHGTVLDIDDQLLCFDVQTEARQMYDELQ